MNTPKTLTVTEYHALCDSMIPKRSTSIKFRKGIRNYTMALLMLDAGLRVGEVVALQISDLYYGRVPVENLTIRAEIAKNKQERIVPLSELIRQALVTLDKECPWLFDELKAGYAFCLPTKHTPLTTRQVERIIRTAAMKSIGRPVHPHMLRHTFGTRLMRKTNARVVQELLGHSQMSSTQIYMSPNGEDLKKAISDIEEPETNGQKITTALATKPLPANSIEAAGTNHNHS